MMQRKCIFIFQTIHKKTFYYLEQLILKHKLHQNALNIKEIHGRSYIYLIFFHIIVFIYSKGGPCYFPYGLEKN